MTQKFLQYVREELMTATADLSGATKGQLIAWTENAQFDTGRLRRKRVRIRDEVTGKMITLTNDPIPGQQSRAKGSSIALVQPVEYSTASWRRAVMSMEDHQKGWLLWCYGENIQFEHQVAIMQWSWAEFKSQLGARKIAGKTLERLKALIWLAAQEVKKSVHGGEQYTGVELAELAGVEEKNWYKTYGDHWQAMLDLYSSLDCEALYSVSRSRSQQKATNFIPSIAKVEKNAHI